MLIKLVVLEYIALFDDLMHQLFDHDPYVNPAILTGQYIDVLKDDIKIVVMLRHPKDLDIASFIAILQEEVVPSCSVHDIKIVEPTYHSRSSSKFHSWGQK